MSRQGQRRGVEAVGSGVLSTVRCPIAGQHGVNPVASQQALCISGSSESHLSIGIRRHRSRFISLRLSRGDIGQPRRVIGDKLWFHTSNHSVAHESRCCLNVIAQEAWQEIIAHAAKNPHRKTPGSVQPIGEVDRSVRLSRQQTLSVPFLVSRGAL